MRRPTKQRMTPAMRAPFTLGILALLGLAGSCSAPGGPPIPEIAALVNATLAPAEYVLEPGDNIQVSFPGRADWSRTVLVWPDGRASFTGVGTLPVAGLTPTQLEERLKGPYGALFDTGQFGVSVATLAPRTITVLGEVGDPGLHPLEPGRRMTLVDALALAGGPIRGTAHLGSLVLVRWDDASQKQLSWTIDARPRHWSEDSMILVQARDLIYVPNTTVDKVNIWLDKYIRQNLPLPQLFVRP